VLEEISFEVADGEFCVLLGPSGCGKTTLLRLVAGLEEASGGTIWGLQAAARPPFSDWWPDWKRPRAERSLSMASALTTCLHRREM